MLRFVELAIFAGLIITVLGTVAWRFYFKPLSERQKVADAKAKNAWASTLNIISDIKSEWIEYETTDNFLLDFPSLMNRDIPEVDAYHKLMLRFSTEFPAIEEMRKSTPNQETLEFMNQIISAHSTAKSRARQIDS